MGAAVRYLAESSEQLTNTEALFILALVALSVVAAIGILRSIRRK